MLRYFAQYGDDGNVLSIGIGAGSTEITKEEYDAILHAIRSRPAPPDGKGYRLKTDLTWEEYDLPPKPEPGDEDELNEAEALDILLGGAT